MWCKSLLIVSIALSLGYSWEVKQLNGDSYDLVKFAVSLEDHNDAFTSAEYCMSNGIPNGFDRRLCLECSECQLKKRGGFGTEEEWQAAVTQEMSRLHEGPSGQTGTWMVEAPRKMELDTAIIAGLETSLNLSLQRVIKSETHNTRYFVVAGTPTEVQPGLAAAGCTTFTPIPPSLKIDPVIVEAAATAAATVGGGVRGDDGTLLVLGGIQVDLTPTASQPTPNSPLAARATALATAWSGLVATTLGRSSAEVRVQSGTSIQIEGVTSSEAGLVAESLALQHDGGYVEVIRPLDQFRPTSNLAAGNILQGDWYDTPNHKWKSYPLWAMGIKGQGQIIGVADSGLDWDHCFFRDSNRSPKENDFREGKRVWESTQHRKIRQYATWEKSDAKEVEHGHGTHVCGSAAGTEQNSDSEDRGLAFKAKLAFFDIDNADTKSASGENVLEIPTPLHTELFPIPYRVGARIHANPWSSDSTRYTSVASDMDKFAWDHQDFLILTGAGNGGGEPNTIKSPGVAKNVVTVGMSQLPENDLELYKDSGRGPTIHGRLKPDVIAPGWSVTSSDGRPGGSQSCGTASLGGTSMSTGVLTGLSALVRQYFMEGWYRGGGEKNPAEAFVPMASLIKAVLVNSGKEMRGEEAIRQGTGFPNQDQGFGLVIIDRTLKTKNNLMDERRLYVDGEWSAGCGACPTLTRTGEAVEYAIKTPGFSQRGNSLKFTLVWADHPGSGRLLNDLDITVTMDGFPQYTAYPNDGMRPDRTNNVEHISIPYATGGTYRVRVEAADIVIGPQPYALVIHGGWEEEVEKTKVPPPAVDACVGVVCLHEGVCVTDKGGDPGSYRCECATGFDGPRCELTKKKGSCGPPGNPCDSGGECITDGAGWYTCDCTGTGHEGPKCQLEIDECDPNRCLNGGRCMDEINGFTCECVNGYYGDTCSFAPGASCEGGGGRGPCMNGGDCVVTPTDPLKIACNCPDNGYHDGDLCDHELKNPCSPTPCWNGGTCVDDRGGGGGVRTATSVSARQGLMATNVRQPYPGVTQTPARRVGVYAGVGTGVQRRTSVNAPQESPVGGPPVTQLPAVTRPMTSVGPTENA